MDKKISWILISSSFMAVGCSEPSESQDPPPPIDAAALPDAVPMIPCDEPRPGNDYCEWISPFSAPNGEGGEVRIELFQQGEGSSRLAVQAFFFKEQDPLLRPMIGDSINDPMSNQGYGCFEFKTGELYNNGASPRHQEIADTRTYVDVGNTVTLFNRDNAEDAMVMAKQPEGTADPSNRIQHDIVYVGAEDSLPTAASLYGWEIAGSDEYPAFDLINGASAATNDWVTPGSERDVYLPQQFTLTSPAEAEYFAGPVTFTKGESLTITWDNVADEHPDSPGIISFVGFVTENDEVESWCFYPGDEGRFIVPSEVLAYVSPSGKILVGKFAHTAWLQLANDDHTRIDLVGVNGKLSSYEIVEP